MRKRSIWFAAVAGCLLHGSFAFPEGPKGKDLVPQDWIPPLPDVRIAPLRELRDDPAADDALTQILHRLSDSPTETPDRHPRDVIVAQTSELAAFAAKYPKSRAALLAKFLTGTPLAREGLLGMARPCYEEIVKLYPATREALLAGLDLGTLTTEVIKLERDPTKTRAALVRKRDALRGALPALKEIDQDNSKLADAFRAFYLGSPGLKFIPRSELQFAGLAWSMGDREEARRLYQRVIQLYPGTPYANGAKSMLDTMKAEDELKDLPPLENPFFRPRGDGDKLPQKE